MSEIQYGALDGVFYFHFAANATSGSGDDGASASVDVRLCGAAASAAPVHSPTASLLSDSGYPAGLYEIAITASVANGYVTANTYAVFATLAVDSQNPSGYLGKIILAPVIANATQVPATVATAANQTAMMGGTFSGATDSLEAIRDRGDAAWTTGAGGSSPTVEQIRSEMDSNSTQLQAIVGDTNELQTDWTNGGRLDQLVDDIKVVTDALNASIAEPSGVPAATPTLLEAIARLYAPLVNRVIVNSNTGEETVHNSANTAQYKRTFADAGGIYTANKSVAP